MQEMTHRHSRELDIFYKEHRNCCTNCGKAFKEGMRVHLGYSSNQIPAVLCDTCASKLEETVVRYSWMKQKFELPAPNDKLWRYMDLGKFIHLISNRKLYFSSASAFDDPFEGAKGVLTRKEKWDRFYLDFFREAIRTAPGMSVESKEPDRIEKDAQRLLSQMNSDGETERKHTFISCWHCNEFESEAMWKLYSCNIQNAVAIQTTASRLYEALDRDPYIDIGKVNYIDYDRKFAPINRAFWYKRKSFEHEREVRAVIHSFDCSSVGISVPVDINMLIESIYISPYAPKWFEEVVQSVVEKYEITGSVVHSNMAETPFY